MTSHRVRPRAQPQPPAAPSTTQRIVSGLWTASKLVTQALSGYVLLKQVGGAAARPVLTPGDALVPAGGLKSWSQAPGPTLVPSRFNLTALEALAEAPCYAPGASVQALQVGHTSTVSAAAAETPLPGASGCTPIAEQDACAVAMSADLVKAQPEYLQSLLSGNTWRNCRQSRCGRFVSYDPSAPVTLTYSLSSPTQMNTELAEGYAATGLSEASQAVVRSVLAELKQFINIDFREVTGPANIAYAETQAPNRSWAGITWSPVQNLTAVDFDTEHYATLFHVVAHETGHAIGQLSHPFTEGNSPSLTRATLDDPSAGWPDALSSTVMAYDFPVHDEQYHYGPLDLAAFAFNYGLAPRLLGDSEHVVDGSVARAYGLHDDSGTNTLRAINAKRVTLTLLGDSSASSVGKSTVRISPTSAIHNADISGTQGGTVIGNDLDNRLVGSARNDVFVLGKGASTVVTHGSCDVVVVPQGATQVSIQDFGRGTRLAFTGPAVDLSQSGNVLQTQGTQVLLPAGAQLQLKDVLRNFQVGKDDPCKSAPLGVIIGSVAGGVSLLAVGAGVAVCLSRRRRAAAASGSLAARV